LEGSGISDEVAARHGVYTTTDTYRIARLLNVDLFAGDRGGVASRTRLADVHLAQVPDYIKGCGEALVYPHHDSNGDPTGNHGVKLRNPRRDAEGKTIKYEAPRGRKPDLNCCNLKLLSDRSLPVFIVEGDKKMMALETAGLPAVAITSAFTWGERLPCIKCRSTKCKSTKHGHTGRGERVLLADFHTRPMIERPLVEWLDGDNENVEREQRILRKQLKTELGGPVVGLKPPRDASGKILKPDDFVKLHGKEGRLKLVEEQHRGFLDRTCIQAQYCRPDWALDYCERPGPLLPMYQEGEDEAKTAKVRFCRPRCCRHACRGCGFQLRERDAILAAFFFLSQSGALHVAKVAKTDVKNVVKSVLCAGGRVAEIISNGDSKLFSTVAFDPAQAPLLNGGGGIAAAD
jgi:hypothetical protein